jgi:hypothetical protein
VPRLRRTIFAIGAAAGLVAFAAAMTAPASAQTLASAPAAAYASTGQARLPAPGTTTFARPAATAASVIPCDDGVDYSPTQNFWRCTGTSVTSRWVASSCAEGEYNAATEYNVYGIINNCPSRVWIHEYMYPKDTTSGWAECVGPIGYADSSGVVNSEYVHPENIMVSANTADC